MSTYTANPQIIWDGSTDANFRLWGKAISDQMLAAGLALQDTNINWASVTHPSSSTSAGYETWKTGDALSSTFPLYIKIEYGNGSAGTLAPMLRLSFGTGNAGGGTLSGNNIVIGAAGSWTSANVFTGAFATSGTGATAYDCYVSSDSSTASSGGARFGFLLYRNHGTTTVPCFFGWERSMDANGNYTAGYWTIATLGTASAGSQLQAIFPLGFGTTSLISGLAAANGATFTTISSSSSTTSWTLGATTAVTPVFPVVGRVDNPLTIFVALQSADQVEGYQFSAVMYGANHNYIFTKNGTAFIPTGGGVAANNLRFAMRYD